MHSPQSVAVLVHYLTFSEMPALDEYNRPLFAYGDTIHDQCERRAYFDAGLFVEEWGDEGHRNGHCLYKMGCKGPSATYNCPNVRWNDGTSWPVEAGHGCIACASHDFWSNASPFYEPLPNVAGFGADTTAQTVGLTAIGGVAALTAVHGVGNGMQGAAGRRSEARRTRPDGKASPDAAPPTETGHGSAREEADD